MATRHTVLYSPVEAPNLLESVRNLLSSDPEPITDPGKLAGAVAREQPDRLVVLMPDDERIRNRLANVAVDHDLSLVLLLAGWPPNRRQPLLDLGPEAIVVNPENEAQLATTLARTETSTDLAEPSPPVTPGLNLTGEVLPGVVFRLDEQGRCQFLFSQTKKLAVQGPSAEGKSYRTVFAPGGKPLLSALEKLLDQEPPASVNRQELYLDSAPETRVDLHAVYQQEPNSKQASIVGTLVDTASTQKSEELYLKEQALASAREGITIARRRDGNHPLIYVNDGFVELTDYPRHEILGRDCRFLQGPKTDPEKVDRMRQALEDDEAVSVEIRNYTRNGGMFWNRVHLSPIRDKSGKVTHYVGIQEDITELREKRKELRQAERLASLGEMAGGVMHEINNPNAVIEGNSRFLLDQWPELEDILTEVSEDFVVKESYQCIEEILRQSDRIQDIVNKVQYFANNQSAVQFGKPLDPQPIIQELLEAAYDDIPYLQATLSDAPDDERHIKADPTELKQIISNLLDNSIDALEEDSSNREPSLVLNTFLQDGKYHMKVVDNGPGIPPDLQEQIFDPFFTTKSPGQGMGLGCSIVRGIVDRMGGEITLDSEPGRTVFCVRFPLVRQLSDGKDLVDSRRF